MFSMLVVDSSLTAREAPVRPHTSIPINRSSSN
jgi:hypothetical protein